MKAPRPWGSTHLRVLKLPGMCERTCSDKVLSPHSLTVFHIQHSGIYAYNKWGEWRHSLWPFRSQYLPGDPTMLSASGHHRGNKVTHFFFKWAKFSSEKCLIYTHSIGPHSGEHVHLEEHVHLTYKCNKCCFVYTLGKTETNFGTYLAVIGTITGHAILLLSFL